MFLFDWFYGILTSLGLWQKEAKILFLGQEFDKRVLLLKLKEPEFRCENIAQQLDRMQYSTSEELSIGKINFKVFDLGGHQTALRVLRDYNAKVDAVVYVVNAYARWRHPESERELDALLSDESLANVPFLIFANAYRPRGTNANNNPFLTLGLLLTTLGLSNLTTGRGIVNLDANVLPLELFICSNFRDHRKAHIDGFEWLSQYIN